MDARATLRGAPSSTRIFSFVIALVAALVVGWAGGYMARGLAVTAPSGTTVTTPHPFVTEPVPYSSPTPSPTRIPEPTGYPNGFAT
jgi:hypothetical protein